MAGSRRTSNERSRPSLFWLLAVFVVPVVACFARIEVRGTLPRQGAFVVAPNHYSELDPLIVARTVWSLGRAPRFLAKESLFRVPVFGAVMRRAGMIPVLRTSTRTSAKQTMAAAAQLAQLGHGLVVYPEGTLTRDPDLWPMRGKSGAVRLALAGGIPLIPMAQWGTQQIMPRYQKRLHLLPPRKRLQFVVGDPIDLSDLTDSASPAAIAAATERLMQAITELLEGIRGEKAPATRWDPTAHGQRETGRLES